MYTPPFFYTSCICILLVSIGGVFRYSSAIAKTNEHIRELKVISEQLDVSHERSRRVVREQATSLQPTSVPEELDTTVPEPTTTPQLPPSTSATLPAQVHLAVPFTSQAPEKNWDQPWQDACEEAAILMLDAYYKGYNLSPLFARDELLKLVNWQQSQGWGGSIDIVDVRSSAAWYMQVSEDELVILRYPEVEEIKTQLAHGNPVLAVADGKTLPNPHFTGDGPVYHALVVIGYDDTTGEFITNDPGTQHGKDFRYKYDDLITSLRDWNGGDVKNGMPVVLLKK